MEILPLEKPLLELSNRIAELKASARHASIKGKNAEQAELQSEINLLEGQFKILASQISSDLSPYEITQLSRHPNRPNTLEIIGELCQDFVELHGDRNFMDDASIVGGLGLMRGHRVMIIGHQKGRGTRENVKRNFGMPKPEGYRKSLRLMSMADRFRIPIVTLIDTPGAYPGIDAEERGQSEAIAKNIMVMFKLGVPIVSLVIGEGGSGGALAIGVGNIILMMQNSTYSVISPEGCASILWKDGSQADRAAAAMGVTSKSAFDLKVIDEIVPEPLGGAHWDPKTTIENIGSALGRHLTALSQYTADELRAHRIAKFSKIGPVKAMPNLSPFVSTAHAPKGWDASWSDHEA